MRDVRLEELPFRVHTRMDSAELRRALQANFDNLNGQLGYLAATLAAEDEGTEDLAEPAAPTIVSVKCFIHKRKRRVNYGARVKFSQVTDNVDGGISDISYYVVQGVACDSGGTPVDLDDDSKPHFLRKHVSVPDVGDTDDLLKAVWRNLPRPKTWYFKFRAAAVSESGERGPWSSWSTPVNPFLDATSSPPPAITGLTSHHPTARRWVWTWDQPPEDAGIDYYMVEVYRKNGPGDFTLVETGYTRNERYTFRSPRVDKDKAHKAEVTPISEVGVEATGVQDTETFNTEPEFVLSDGVPPSSSPTPTVYSGLGLLAARWVGVPNNEPVTYEVHLSTTSDFTPDETTYGGEVSGTLAFIRKTPAGGDLVYGTPYYVKTVAKDVDGSATPSGQGSGTPVRVDSIDIEAEAIELAKFAYGIRPVQVVDTLPTLPDTDYPEGATAFLTTDHKLYRSTGTTWTSAVPTTDLSGQITETQITNAAVTTPKLATRVITTDKLFVANYDNLIGNPSFESGDLTNWESSDWTAVNDGNAHEGIYAIKVVGNETVYKAIQTPPASAWFDVVPGEVYYFEAWVKGLTGANGVVKLQATLMDGQGGNPTYPNFATFATIDDTYHKVSGTLTIPTGKLRMRPYIESTNHTTGTWYCDDVILRRMTPAELIVNGAITTDKLAANAVTAGKIEAGAIGTDQLAADAVVADKIAANAVVTESLAAEAVTADEIAAGSIAADHLLVGSVTAEKLAGLLILASKLVAGQEGTQRVEIDTDGVRLYAPDGQAVLVDLPTDPLKKPYFAGQVVAEALTVIGATFLNDTLIGPAANVVLSLSVGDPQAPPTASVGFPTSAQVMLHGDSVNPNTRYDWFGLFYDANGYGPQATFWTTRPNDNGYYRAVQEHKASDGAYLRGFFLPSSNCDAWGVVRLSTYIFVLYKDWGNGNYYIQKRNQSDLSLVSDTQVSAYVVAPKPGLWTDGAYLYIITTTGTGSNANLRMQQYTAAPAYSATLDMDSSFYVGGGSASESFESGGAVVVGSYLYVTLYTYADAPHPHRGIYAFTWSSRTRYSDGDFYGQSGVEADGITYDGTSFRSVVWSNPVVTHSDWVWTTESPKYWVGNTWYDNTNGYETKVSPRTSLTMRKRAYLIVSVAGRPVGADRMRLYINRGYTEPQANGRFDGRLQVTTDALSYALNTFASGGAQNPASNTFPGGTPSAIKASSGQPLLRANGYSRCTLQYSNDETGNIADATDVFIRYGTEIGTDTDSYHPSTTDNHSASPDSTYNITLPFIGQYMFIGRYQFAAADSGSRQMGVQANGSTEVERVAYAGFAGAPNRGILSGTVITTAANEYIRVFVKHTGTGGGLQLVNSRFLVVYLGPS